ncbi:MAG: hypothetical protein KBS67_06380 [Bacteroidales bacterium]|nr:hypothetical protein [Candidatus Cryptobacteroides equifaecalis]
MKRTAIISMFICALAAACTQRPDDREFIRDMYENNLYEDYTFLEQHCSEGLLEKLSEQYDYEGEGYAVWKFRSGAQDGPSRERSVIHVEDEGDGWYIYTALDMGITFRKKIKISHEGGQTMIEDVADVYRRIAPLPSGIDVDNLQYCTVPAAFSPDDFDWTGKSLRMTVYSEDLYDAVDISMMQTGDTLVYRQEPIVIATLAWNAHGMLEVNGGLEEGGCWLSGSGGGTYRGTEWDDHSSYSKLGKAEVALADDFMIIDCGEFPEDPSDTIRAGQNLYIEKMKKSRPDFFQLNTRVTIEKGLITAISRKWIP